MKPFFCSALFLLVFIVSIAGCKKTVYTEPEVQTPYPRPDEQRAMLANKPWVTPVRILDSAQMIADLEFLASDVCEGRLAGTAGHERAMNHILNRMRSAGVDSFDNSLVQAFEGEVWRRDSVRGKNIIGWIKGSTFPEKYIVISAHYDHLGKAPNGAVYYGADDNASGVACLLALAAYFKNNPHPYSLIFAAFDKEEKGLQGAVHFTTQWARDGRLGSVAFNLNMDMIARSDSNELFACGIFYNPTYMQVINEVQQKTNVKVLMGYDGVPQGEANWATASDHRPFYERSIPFIYLGVEDHPDYHQVTDTYNKINYSRYVENCNMIASLVQMLKP